MLGLLNNAMIYHGFFCQMLQINIYSCNLIVTEQYLQDMDGLL